MNVYDIAEGFAVIINWRNSSFQFPDIVVVSLEEDDEHYWGNEVLNWNDLNIYDKGIAISMINEIHNKDFLEEYKQKLIESLLDKKN